MLIPLPKGSGFPQYIYYMIDIYKDILSYLDEYIYTIDLETKKIIYMSDKLKDIVKSRNDNVPCYRFLYGLKKECLQCPYMLLNKDNKEIVINRKNNVFNDIINHKYIYSERDGQKFLTVILSAKIALDKKTEQTKDEMFKAMFEIVKNSSYTGEETKKIGEHLEVLKNFYKASGAYYYRINSKTLYHDTTSSDIDLFSKEDIILEWCRYFEENKVINEISRIPRKTKTYLKNNGISNILGYGITKDNVSIGFLCLLEPKANTDFEMLIYAATPFIETELEEDLSIKKLNKLANIDNLTGIGNRTSYEDRLSSIISGNIQMPIGIIFADINGLKETNDTYGHKAGDKLIKKTTESINNIFAGQMKDTYRIGGDEFVILFPGISKAGFEKATKPFKEEIKKGNISISAGCKWFDSVSGLKEKITEVDQMMYENKKRYYKTHDRRAR